MIMRGKDRRRIGIVFGPYAIFELQSQVIPDHRITISVTQYKHMYCRVLRMHGEHEHSYVLQDKYSSASHTDPALFKQWLSEFSDTLLAGSALMIWL